MGMNNPSTERPMTLLEAAAVLGLSPSTLRHQIRNAKLTATKRGRDWWIESAEVERYAHENRVTK
jgi:excisionase family DNA binding protein